MEMFKSKNNGTNNQLVMECLGLCKWLLILLR